jgi:hypothetical protein
MLTILGQLGFADLVRQAPQLKRHFFERLRGRGNQAAEARSTARRMERNIG